MKENDKNYMLLGVSSGAMVSLMGVVVWLGVWSVSKVLLPLIAAFGLLTVMALYVCKGVKRVRMTFEEWQDYEREPWFDSEIREWVERGAEK